MSTSYAELVVMVCEWCDERKEAEISNRTGLGLIEQLQESTQHGFGQQRTCVHQKILKQDPDTTTLDKHDRGTDNELAEYGKCCVVNLIVVMDPVECDREK